MLCFGCGLAWLLWLPLLNLSPAIWLQFGSLVALSYLLSFRHLMRFLGNGNCWSLWLFLRFWLSLSERLQESCFLKTQTSNQMLEFDSQSHKWKKFQLLMLLSHTKTTNSSIWNGKMCLFEVFHLIDWTILVVIL